MPSTTTRRTGTSKADSIPTASAAPYWIVIGDLHDKTARLAEIPGLAEAEGVIVTGDITITGGVPQARKVLEAIGEYNPRIFAQIGNMDRAEITDWLENNGWNLHARVRELAPETAVMGVGGSPFTPFGTPSEFPESHFSDWLETMWQTARKSRRIVLVSHTPPRDTRCDQLSDGGHVGSVAVRDFVLECQPDVCLCGHIHESVALDRLGRTVLVNPGALSMGGYAVLRLEGERLSVSLHRLDG